MEATAVITLVVVACGYVLLAPFRRVPAGTRGVVLRRGRAIRERWPGLVFVLPGLERLECLPLNPEPINPLQVTARSRDGVEIRLEVDVRWRIVDFSAAAESTTPARWVVADAVDRALHHTVADLPLSTLLAERESVVASLPATTNPRLAGLGVELVAIDLLDVEVRVGTELLRLLT